MMRFKFLVATLWVMLATCGSGVLVADSVELDSAEAQSLEFNLLFSELKKDYYEAMGEHWATTALAGLAAEEQESLELLEGLATQYAVQVSDQYWGCNIVFITYQELNFYCGLFVTSPWWDEWEEALSVAAYFEELGIRELQRSLQETNEQALIDAYNGILRVNYVHLYELASMLYVNALDYQAQLLDQATVDQVLVDAIAMNTQDFEINPGLNDAWYEPATNGQGFFITVFPDSATVFLGWFTFDMAFPGQEAIANLGDACQRWLTAQGTYDGAQAELVVYNSSGGLFDTASPTPALEAIGTITLAFENCQSGYVSYDLPQVGLSGTIPIQRLAQDNVAACEARTIGH